MELPELDLGGRVAIVTGGGRSIGRATARLLARAGADVALVGRDAEALERVAGEIEPRGRRALALTCDVSDAAAVDVMMERCRRELGPPDILVANAGLFQTWQPSEQVSIDEFDRVTSVDLRGVWITCQAAGREMLKGGAGSIVTVSSIAGLVALPGTVSYNAAKAGVVALSKTLAAEWAPRGVRVNCVAPGFIERDVEPLNDDEEAKQRIFARTPLGRFGTPDDVAMAVLYLVSDAAAFVVGATLAVDGGWLAV